MAFLDWHATTSGMSLKRPFSEADWTATPEPVCRYMEALALQIEKPEESHAQLLRAGRAAMEAA
jgi:hypothetical protein